jgi:hypothetical protein
MINGILNNLQLYKTKWSSDLADENMLQNLLLTAPHKISPVISYIFGRYDQGNVIDYITNGLGRTVTVESPIYEWDVMIEHDKAILIKKAVFNGTEITSGSALMPGVAGSTIQLWLGEKWFGPGAILEFDDINFQARVIAEPYMDGNDYVYTIVCSDGKDESFIPPSLLLAGARVSRLASAYEEYSDEADIFNYQTPFKLRNQMNIVRASYDITGSAFSSVMVIALRDPQTKKETKYWSAYQEWTAWRQWYERLDRLSVYSKYNAAADGTVALKGTNGRPVRMGAGLLEQIAPANRKTYTTLTLETVDTFLSDLSYNIRGFSERNFMALAGEMALREWDRVLRDKASGYTLVDSKFISGSGQELTLGGQFVTYKGLNGVTLTLKHLPLYDDPIHHRKLHPVTGKPLESYRITILDIGMRDGEANLKKVVRKDRELVVWHTAGAVAPGSGHAKSISTLRSNAKDGYSVHFLSEQGIMLSDPTTCGELICDAE